MGGSSIHNPRRGSLQIWPRVRAKRSYPSIKAKPKSKVVKLHGFIGYKVGMTHIMFKDTNTHSMTKNQNIAHPTTIIECPPIKPLLLRFYQKTTNGLQIVGEIPSSLKIDKKLKLIAPKKTKEPESFDEIRLVVYTTPSATGIGKKNPDVLELNILGDNKEEQLKVGKELLTKEIKVSDIFQEGQMVDIHAVTTGKGFQGTVKRYGVKIRQHKSEKTKRGIGTLGPWTPKKVLFTVAQPGKMGYHSRVDFNKQVLKISSKPEEVNPKGGFVRYGEVKNEWLMVKGSIPGPKKRTIIVTEPIRPKKPSSGEVTYISRESKQ